MLSVHMKTKVGIRTGQHLIPGSFWTKTEVQLEELTTSPPLALSEGLALSSFRIGGLEGCAAWGSEDTSGTQAACPSWVKDHKLFGRGRSNTEQGCEDPLASCWEFLMVFSQQSFSSIQLASSIFTSAWDYSHRQTFSAGLSSPTTSKRIFVGCWSREVMAMKV